MKYKHCCLRREPGSLLSRYAVPVVLLLLLSVLVALWAKNLLFGAAVSVAGGMFLFLMYPPTRYRRFSWFHARQAVEHRYATHSFGKDPHRIRELTEEPWFDAEDEAGS